MEITEVRIFPRESRDRKLKAYATITMDNAFVVRNVKVIEGNKGLFVAMPSRKLRDACPKCGHKNAMRSKYCNQCGVALPQVDREAEAGDDSRRQSGHRDIAHPITPECREYIQKKVLKAYEEETKGKGRSDAAGDIKPKSEPVKSEPVRSEPVRSDSKPKAQPKPTDVISNIGNDEDFEGDLEF